MEEDRVENFDVECFYGSALIWIASNLWCIYKAWRLAATTAAPFLSGRILADCDNPKISMTQAGMGYRGSTKGLLLASSAPAIESPGGAPTAKSDDRSVSGETGGWSA
eukprot:6840621-Prymnesium_polylepis.1